VSTIALPPDLESSISCHMSLRVSGSRPVVGSSRKTTRGEPISAIASETRRRCPPERVEICELIFLPSATELATVSTASCSRFFKTPLRRA
jgi:hypothetical protein